VRSTGVEKLPFLAEWRDRPRIAVATLFRTSSPLKKRTATATDITKLMAFVQFLEAEVGIVKPNLRLTTDEVARFALFVTGDTPFVAGEARGDCCFPAPVITAGRLLRCLGNPPRALGFLERPGEEPSLARADLTCREALRKLLRGASAFPSLTKTVTD
jgi:hypothetical protein